ncbi:MAG: hypothetical protein GXO29_01540 [Thermotogae bacterium]|nr:hypothetical protein [Thermotogota bacterium]
MKAVRHSLDFAEFDPAIGKALVFGYPYAYRSAFLNQYFEEAIKSSHPKGPDVLYDASLFANYRVLRAAGRSMGLKGEEFLDFAESFFMSMGYGNVQVSRKDIKLVASPIAHTYLYVHRTPSETPVCNFQRGFISASLSIALDSPPGSLFTEEVECVAMQDPVCRMIPKVQPHHIDFPDVSYSDIPYYRVEDPTFMDKVQFLKRVIPSADDTGNIQIPSSYHGLKRAAYMYMPTDYFSYATWKALTEGDRDTADLMLKFTGYVGFLMTFVSLYYTPIGKIAYGNPDTPEDLFSAIIGSMKYWGMGIWRVEEVREGQAVVYVHNFYENDFQRLVGVEEPYSPYVVGGIMAILYAVYEMRFYLNEEGFDIGEAIRSYDNALEKFEAHSQFNRTLNAQVVDIRW